MEHVIESLLKIVLLCGKQGLALHGHRDDWTDWSEESSTNEQLVYFQAETDSILAGRGFQECLLHFKRHSKGINRSEYSAGHYL